MAEINLSAIVFSLAVLTSWSLETCLLLLETNKNKDLAELEYNLELD